MNTTPNILFIMSDQMVAALTGAYEHPVVQTPNLNRLCEHGIRFDAAYTPFPVCSPARACTMAGRHASEIGAWDNGALYAADQPSMAHYLSNAGYDTVLSGKMHFIGPDQVHGFNRRLTTDIYSSDFSWVKQEWIDIKANQGRDHEKVMADRQSYNAEGYTADQIHVGKWHNALSYDEETHFRAIEYLRTRKNNTDPFMLVASYHHPHEPFHTPNEYWDLYEDAEIILPNFPENIENTYSMMDRCLNSYHGIKQYNLRDTESLYKLRRSYYGLVTYMDNKVGELLDTLEQTGLADNTVVVFASDHGDMLCEKEMVQKRCFYEWSCRVPLIMRFPDHWQAGTKCETPISLIDLLPTFCDIANVHPSLPHDGENLINLIDKPAEDRTVFAQAHEAVGMPCIMARKGKFKYNYIHGHRDQLFNLTEDPDEWHNLIGDALYADIANDLRSEILDRFDPETIASDTLESLLRRQLINETMTRHKQTWCHFPKFDYTRGSMDQYLP